MAKQEKKLERKIEIRRSKKENPDNDRKWIVQEVVTETVITSKTIFRASSRNKCRYYVRENNLKDNSLV
jgi:hypothetical protein